MDNEAFSLLVFLFRNLDALYATLLQFSNKWADDRAMGIRSGGTYSMYIGIDLQPISWALLRSAIGLYGDIFCITKRLSSLNVGNATQAVHEVLAQTEQFRELRNFCPFR